LRCNGNASGNGRKGGNIMGNIERMRRDMME